jgi:hypothetical protein
LRRWTTYLAIAAFSLLAPATSQAQNIGAQFDWGSETDIGVGGRVEFPLINVFTNTGAFSRAFLITSFDWYPDPCDGPVDCTFWELNGNLAVPIPAQTLRPYFGGGLNLAHQSVGDFDDSELGINLLGGLKFPISTLTGFAEARIVLSDADQFVLTFGVLFGK